MQRVTDNVCTDTTLRGCNPSYVTTADGVVVIDTPQLPTRAVAMRQEAEAQGPIRYLINTEHHVDHIFGNYFFKGAGTVVNHQALYDRFMVVTPDLDPYAYAYESIPGDKFPRAAGGSVTVQMAREDNFGEKPTVYANADRSLSGP